MAKKRSKKAAKKKSKPSKRTAKKKTVRKPATPQMPTKIYGIVSPRSVGGVSMFDGGAQISSETVENFQSEDDVITRAAYRLQDAGFEILQITDMTINIAGSRKLYEQAFDARLVSEERTVIKEHDETTAAFIDCVDTELPGLIRTAGTAFDDIIEGVAIEEPVYFFAESALPPTKAYWHLDVPADVSLGCNADRAHRSGTTGRGVTVAMVDSGWYRHPFFTRRGYRAAPVVLGPAASNPTRDESGHGTGESANIFSVAPDVRLLPVKINFVNSVGAFNAAVGLSPDIVTNSWGSSVQNGPLSARNQALAAAIASAVRSGIVVIFSAGNGHWGFPGQHPDVISAGGVFMDNDESLRASDYSSGFNSNIYAGRRVPDLSGLVGMRPGASYIMLPLEPGDAIDVSKSGGTHPPGDETLSNDGWAAFSGTSAAAPQLAGAAALIKQACRRLTPAQVRSILMRTARDVVTGTNHPNFGNRARRGPDTATGNGLVDAHRAALLAKIRCIRVPRPPVVPIRPIQPAPIQPAPIQPIRPPIVPIRPPIAPIRPPIQPIRPSPIRPIAPVVLSDEADDEEAQEYNEEMGQQMGYEGLSTEDVEALEEILLDEED